MGSRASVFAPRKKRHFWRWIALVLALIIAAVGVYTAFDNGRVMVKTQRVLVANLPDALEGFTVLHISDLNGKRFGPAQKQLRNALKEKRYHAVCLTGDMVGPNEDSYPLQELLLALDTTRPVFFIAGDSDPVPVGGQDAGFYSPLADWVLALQARGATFLGAPASMSVGNTKVWFTDVAQLALDLDGAAAAYAGATTTVSQYYAQVIEDTQMARTQMRESDLHIALSHEPVSESMINTMRSASGMAGDVFVRSVNLILAGGTAGGQWRLPLIGPVWMDGWFPAERDVEGYHHTGALLQYISGGLGTSAKAPLPDFRLFNTPEVTLITFTSQMDDGVLPDD